MPTVAGRFASGAIVGGAATVSDTTTGAAPCAPTESATVNVNCANAKADEEEQAKTTQCEVSNVGRVSWVRDDGRHRKQGNRQTSQGRGA